MLLHISMRGLGQSLGIKTKGETSMKRPLEKSVSLRLAEDDFLLLQAVAEKREISVSALIREYIKTIREENRRDE